MHGRYLGYVPPQDRLHGFLTRIMCDRMGLRAHHPQFRVFGLHGSNEVYAYEEKATHARIICKFYGPKFGWDRDRAAGRAYQEYASLETLRSYDLVGSPHHVIYGGEQLSHAINQSIVHHDDAHLFWRLKALAYFLATQHNRTANGEGVDFDVDCRYFDGIISSLQKNRRIGEWDAQELQWLRDCWREQSKMWADQQVWLHGDATPANFLFGHGLDVAAIDLERMKRGDRMFDVGRIAGELQHSFMVATGDRHRAEPFIGHFLWEYSCHFPDRQSAFASITTRAPYYMGLNLLRIARNDYISNGYGRSLVAQAKHLLRSF
jgi:hypothetical protein